MKFIYADSLDMVDPQYDFETDRNAPRRRVFHDDVFAHELLGHAPYDGILVSLATAGSGRHSGSKYSFPRLMRLRRIGSEKFLRLDQPQYGNLLRFGDCGSFSYHAEELPLYTPDEVLSFYQDCDFTHGCSVDHVIFEHDDTLRGMNGGYVEARRRFDITLEYADVFFRGSRELGPGFTPLGVVQGWSPGSMAEAARRLVAMGYDYLAVGGMVPLKADQIKACVQQIHDAVPDARLHILGFAKADNIADFGGMGITSFDSTSPLLRAFKDAKANYYLRDGNGMSYYTAIRVPQALENKDLVTLAKMGVVSQEKLGRMENDALKALRAFDKGETSLDSALDAVMTYSTGGIRADDPRLTAKAKLPGSASSKGLEERYRRTLEDRPWKQCPCPVCKELSIEVILYRGLQRNKRRGIHNLETYHSLVRDLRCDPVFASDPSEDAADTSTLRFGT